MAQKIGIGVSAELDTSAVEQKINELGQKIAQANKVQFTPLRDSTAEDLDRILKQFEQLRRIQGDLNRRMKQTGQGDSPMLSADWDRLYVDPAVRARQMRKAFEYATGMPFHEPVPPPQSARPRPDDRRQEGPRRPGQESLPGMGVAVAQSGLRAMGPAGGVAAGALGTGMAAGFGAGLMGLLGGMLALGVGKLVGSAMEKMGQAEDNSVAFDRLKRVLGDVNVSFDRLKVGLSQSATAATVTIDEAARLTTQFAKLGNVTREQELDLSDELRTGVGLSRAFGLDPTQGVGIMGQMRGMRITSDVQESRRFALLIGETIGKSDAFARADEVMEALANYATMQTRNAMRSANVEGFAGLYSSMVGSGLAGMDPAGANALIARLNASLSQGGAFGEASQFLSVMAASDIGLNPIQMQVLREGGAFATSGDMFGEDSAYARYMGRTGPAGDSTWYEATRSRIERMHPGNSEEAKLMRAMAFANHMGVNLNQAMSLLSINPNEMGGLQRYAGNLGELNTAGISSLYSVVYGSEQDRVAVANELYKRTGDGALTETERADLDRAMTQGGAEEQREILAALISSRDQEQTQGKDIRDSKTALENIKTAVADKLIPITQEIRQGIMYMAGGGKKSPRDILEDMLKLDSRDREITISRGFEDRRQAATEDHIKIRNEKNELSERLRKNIRSMSDDEIAAVRSRISELSKQYPEKYEEARQKIKDLHKDEVEALKKEEEDLENKIRKLNDVNPSTVGDSPVPIGAGTGRYQPRGVGGGLPKAVGGSESAKPAGSAGRAAGVGGNVQRFVEEYGPLANKVSEALGVPPEAVLGQWGLETGWGRSVIPGTNNLGNIKDTSGKGPKARDNMTGSVDSYRAYGDTDEFGDAFIRFLKGRRYRDVQGAQDPLEYFSILKDGGYAEDPNYVSKGVAASRMARRAIDRGYGGTPMPADAQASGDREAKGVHVTIDPLEVLHRNERGEHVAPPQELKTRVNSLWSQ